MKPLAIAGGAMLIAGIAMIALARRPTPEPVSPTVTVQVCVERRDVALWMPVYATQCTPRGQCQQRFLHMALIPTSACTRTDTRTVPNPHFKKA